MEGIKMPVSLLKDRFKKQFIREGRKLNFGKFNIIVLPQVNNLYLFLFMGHCLLLKFVT